MAAREHRVSRRVLLGAACVCVLPGPAGALPSSSPRRRPGSMQRWHRAFAAFQCAEGLLKAAAHEPDEDRYGDILDTFHDALCRLLHTAAPDLPALSLKIDLAVDHEVHEVHELTGGEACLAALKRDARRLAFRSS